MREGKFNLSYLIVASLLLLAGSAYMIYLHGLFPRLVPSYGGGERFWLDEANNFTFQIPWSAVTRLHLTLQANDTVELYRDGKYVCDCSKHELVVEKGDEALIILKSSSPVNGIFRAKQEIPLEKQLVAIIMLITGIVCLRRSTYR